MRLELTTPAAFSFRRTVLSHGWCLLPPFVLGPGARWLGLTVELPGGGAAPLRLETANGNVVLRSPGRREPGERRHLEAAARRVLGLDLDLGEFHRAVRADPRLRWIARRGTGRLLRGATAFEDLVKLILTTNCSWSLTTRMTAALVERYGAVGPGGERAFPSAASLGDVSESEFRTEVRVGYRSGYLARLARVVASGELDPERWEHDPRPTEEIRREILTVPGAGPYVVENLLKFLGRPDGLALDSWMRSKFARVYHGGRRVRDRTIARRYARAGRWAGLAAWFDLTRDWFDGEEPSTAWENLV